MWGRQLAGRGAEVVQTPGMSRRAATLLLGLAGLLALDARRPLLLSPLLDAGRAPEARGLSRVRGGPFPDHVTSYSGFLTVQPRYRSHLFFWFFPAQVGYPEAPLIVWLQGGPGQPSLIGVFMEVGPFTVAADGASLEDNPHSWHRNYSLLFIDNPVGTGFSFTEDDRGYARNQHQVAQGLYSAVLQFLTLFPELQQSRLYVAGESYGGKHAISLAHYIHKGNPSANITVNLKGLFIVSGFVDPVSCLHYSDFLYQVGLVDFRQRGVMRAKEKEGRELIRRGRFDEALRLWNAILNFCQHTMRIGQVYNFLTETYPVLDEDAPYFRLVQRAEVRRALHVGTRAPQYVGRVYASLGGDIVRSARPWLEALLDAGYRVASFSGQLDVIVAYPLSERMYRSLRFAAAAEYRAAERRPWYVAGELAGYCKTAGNFTEVLVRGAGHMVPLDRPGWTLAFVHRVVAEAG